jgi:hypothetical protein
MRDIGTIDSELRLPAPVRRTIREHGGEPSNRQVDELLDERNELAGKSTPLAGLVHHRRAGRVRLDRLSALLALSRRDWISR